MTSYRKKPVVIEAWQVHPNDGATRPLPPDWLLQPLIAATRKGEQVVGDVCVREDGNGLDIYTLEGVMHAQVGDWIIRGVKGELYPCKPDIFAATYEPADALAAQPAAEPVAYPALPEPDLHALLSDCRGYLQSYAHAAIDADRAVAAQPARAGGDAPTDERAAFEAWCRSVGKNVMTWAQAGGDTHRMSERSLASYVMSEANERWEAWQARAALAAAPQPQADTVPVPRAVYDALLTWHNPRGESIEASLGLLRSIDAMLAAAPQPAAAEPAGGEAYSKKDINTLLNAFANACSGGDVLDRMRATKAIHDYLGVAFAATQVEQPAASTVSAIRPELLAELRADNAKESPGMVYMLPDGRALFRSSAECKESGWLVPKEATLWDLVPEDLPLNLGELLATLDAAPAAVERQLPDEMDDELRDILGTVCFRAIHFAQAARSAGHQIDTRAEAEQAAFIWWKLGHYLKHGAAGWRDAAVADLKAMQAAGIGSSKEGGE